MTVKALMPAGLAMGIGRHDLAGRGKIVIQPRASAVFENGSAAVHRDGVQLAEVPLSATPRTDLVTLGRYEGDGTFAASATADSNGGALNADGTKQSITLTPISEVGTGWFATGTGVNLITEANLDQPCFWYDDDTLYLTDLGGTLSYAGHVAAIDPTTNRVAVKSSELWRGLYLLFSAGETAGAAVTSEVSCRGVITSLGAYTGAGTGTLTVTATGALGTQDGVTSPLVGQIFHLPAYGGTANASVAVLAADSGPYEIVNPGATGVKAVLARPAKWSHGATIAPGTLVKVVDGGTLFGNTKWYAAPGGLTKVVGTDDPGLYPDRVVQSGTLVASALAITNVPIRSATKSSVRAELSAVGGTTTSTIGYGTVVAATPGALGTATATVNAIASGGTKNGTADTSVLTITVTN